MSKQTKCCVRGEQATDYLEATNKLQATKGKKYAYCTKHFDELTIMIREYNNYAESYNVFLKIEGVRVGYFDSRK